MRGDAAQTGNFLPEIHKSTGHDKYAAASHWLATIFRSLHVRDRFRLLARPSKLSVDKESLQRAIEITQTACKLNGAELSRFLDEQCGVETELRSHVELLLDANQATGDQTIQRGASSGPKTKAEKLSSNTKVLTGDVASKHREALKLFTRINELADDEAEKIVQRECDGDPTLRALVERMRTAAKDIGLAPNAVGHRKPETSFGLEGDTLGDYDLIDVIGQGGMGVVYRARQQKLDRIVAIKVLRSAGITGEARERFHMEAESVAILDHPNIVPIYEIGEVDNVFYFSMKLIDGTSLEDAISDFPDDIHATVHKMITIAKAVHHSHQNGILHRDLKPANILIDSKGTPFVTDFGIAKKLEADTSATQTGQILGTPAYLSPEQAEAGTAKLTTATDVYGLGAILYEMLTGQRVIPSQSLVDALKMIAESDPTSPRSLNPRIDRDLENICLHCLQKSPIDRYASADAFASDLERWLRNEPVTARPIRAHERVWKWCRRRPGVAALWLFVIVFSIASIMTIGWKWVDAERQRDLAMAAQEEAEKERDRANAEAETSREVSRFLRGLLEEGDPIAWGGRLFGQPVESSTGEKTLKELLETGTRQLELSLQNDPLVRAELLQTFASAWLGIGDAEQAQKLFAEAEELVEANYPAGHPERIFLLHNQARVLLAKGELVEAERRLLEALDEYKKLLTNGHRGASDRTIRLRIADIQFELSIAILASSYERAAESRELLIQSRDTRIELLGLQDRTILWSIVGIAMTHLAEPKGEQEAMPYLLDAVSRLESNERNSWIELAIGFFVRAKISEELGDLDQAESCHKQTIEILTDTLGARHYVTITARRQLAHFYYWRRDEYEKSEIEWRQVHDFYMVESGGAPEQISESAMNLGRCRRQQGDIREAIDFLNQSIDARLSYIESSSSSMAECLNVMRGLAARRMRQRDGSEEGEEILVRLLEIADLPQIKDDEDALRVKFLTCLHLHELTSERDSNESDTYLEQAEEVAKEMMERYPSEENRNQINRVNRIRSDG